MFFDVGPQATIVVGRHTVIINGAIMTITAASGTVVSSGTFTSTAAGQAMRRAWINVVDGELTAGQNGTAWSLHPPPPPPPSPPPFPPPLSPPFTPPFSSPFTPPLSPPTNSPLFLRVFLLLLLLLHLLLTPPIRW